MAYERYPRGNSLQGDYYAPGDDYYGRDYGSGQDRTYTSAREYEAAGMLWHGGGTFGMTSQVVLYPQTQEGYVLLANDACEGTESTLKQIAQQLHAAPNG